MNCKHIKVEGNKKICKAKEKAIDEYECNNCMLRISDLPPGFEEIFGKGFKR